MAKADSKSTTGALATEAANDPIFAAIERHKATFLVSAPVSSEYSKSDPDAPGYHAIERKARARNAPAEPQPRH